VRAAERLPQDENIVSNIGEIITTGKLFTD